MGKKRFSAVKNHKHSQTTSTNLQHNLHCYASLRLRTKAFLTDIFMILMPLLYFVIYVIMGSLENASHEKMLSWLYALIPYVMILSIFMIKDKGRSPGLRSQSLQVVSNTHTKATPFSIIFRNLSFLLTLAMPFIWVLPLFRKDHKTLHDLLSATVVIVAHNSDV